MPLLLDLLGGVVAASVGRDSEPHGVFPDRAPV
jgi:hypothetical protein